MSRHSASIVLALGLASGLAAAPPTSAAAAPAAVRCCRVPAGTVVMVELAEAVGARTHKAGDTFAIRLAEPIVVNGQIVLPAGTPGTGEVIQASKPGLGGKAAKLVLAARELRGPYGGPVPLKALQLSAAGKGRATAATALGLGGIGFAPLGVVAFAIRGGDVEFPAGTEATAKVSAAFTLAPLRRAPREAADSARRLADESPPAQGAVAIGPPPRGEGQIVFFRRKSLLGTGQWFNVREDGQALGKLTNGAYFVLPVKPGVHTFTAKTEPQFNDHLKLQVDAGETYFVEGVLSKGVLIGAAALTPSDRAAFDEVSRDLKLAEGPGEAAETRPAAARAAR